MDQFKYYLLSESKHYLGQRSGDILTALQNLQEDAPGMGQRALLRASQGIVNQIRRILHGRWDEEDVQYLKRLQKIGVAIMKAIDENEDIKEVISSAVAEMEGMLNKLQMPINSLGTEDTRPADDDMQPPDDGPISSGHEMKA
jgi:hypothetical protein